MYEVRDIEIYRGDTLVFQVEVTEGMVYDDEDNDDPLDMTGYSYLAQVRRTEDSDDILGTFVVDSSEEATGTLTLRLYDTENIELPFGTGVWDLEITSPDATPIVTTTHKGDVTYEDDVTREED